MLDVYKALRELDIHMVHWAWYRGQARVFRKYSSAPHALTAARVAERLALRSLCLGLVQHDRVLTRKV